MNFTPQHDQMDCGPACLAMIAGHYGKKVNIQYIREQCFISREGVSLLGISMAADKIGLETKAVKIDINHLEQALLPCILHWNQNHFVVLYKISTTLFSNQKKYKIADPGYGLISLSVDKFKQAWLAEGEKGIALFIHPTERFQEQKVSKQEKQTLAYVWQYLNPYRKQVLQLFTLLFLGTLTTLVFPILTQKLIDEGVNKANLSVITYVLMAQLAFFLGNIVFSIGRNWIMLIMGTKINIQIISNFLKKLLQLPIKFFDTKLMGDFNHRIQDHERIEQFLTSDSLLTVFSMFTFSVFFGVLWYYDVQIVILYIAFTAVSIGWSLYWMRKRKILDYFRFEQRSENQEAIYEIINGVSEMKLNQLEESKRIEWEEIQQKLFVINKRILKVDQVQLSGFEFINQLKNIVVTFLAAYLVVHQTMSLGSLLSVSYIIGQLNSPINQLISFFRSLQDAKLSLTRLNEVQQHPIEEQEGLKPLSIPKAKERKEEKHGIFLKNLSFQYEGPQSPYILKDITLFFPQGKVTAIVGASGSGKTTLMKLLLRFYDPCEGSLYYNNEVSTALSPKSIRENCGVVMQDGYIFSDTIARNIATSDTVINEVKLSYAAQIANIESFINTLPLGYNTKIGAAGNGISGGQKQRILIARAVYKNPPYLFFDEATSALDAENEKVIHDNLQAFFKGKTVLIIAHRLSTVKQADHIIVLKQGQCIEEGNHQTLVTKRGAYYNLIKNQLELGSS
ncbi:peptidase domain-containing ABC transporter [Myroides sp. NP-2]|uniref:peptidase domain-containing ABC transporter n=1 Tax=Myroides sp. NP-2 TaxID=2759945 RepID=UPI0015F9B398|nr:peptidase domain-containing ABC transporter [Myroides sp. NP-2]MBB1149788.1 peptidase domain-containing ABC transporter [Myroides sp. NP-2]